MSAVMNREEPEGRPERRRERGGVSGAMLLGAGMLGALALGGWFFLWSGGEAVEIDEARVVTVTRGEVLDAVTASGRVEPLARVAVMSRASGIIEALLVEEGDRVAVGDRLAELDREQLAAELAQDQADLASAEARVAAAEGRLIEAKARLQDPELHFAQRQADRLQQLFENGDVAESANDEAALALARVEFRLAQIRSSLPVLEAAVKEASANLLSAQAAVERAETSMREATIKSQIDGVVLVRDKEVGDGVSSILTAGGNATQIMTLGDLSEMFVEARVDEVDLGRITVGMPARITVDAYREVPLEGAVERIAPAGSVDNNGITTFELRVSVKDPDGLLRPDMTADAKLVLRARADALILPQRAIERPSEPLSGESTRGTVQRVVGEGEDARVETRSVTLGISDGLMTEIVDGLSEGDRVLLPQMGPGRRGR